MYILLKTVLACLMDYIYVIVIHKNLCYSNGCYAYECAAYNKAIDD